MTRKVRLANGLLPASAAIIILLLEQSAYAAAWDWGSQVSLSGRYNDNPTLRADRLLTELDPDTGELVTVAIEPESTLSTVATADLELIRATPNSSISIKPRISRNYYPDRDFSDLENTNWYLSGTGDWSRKRTRWSLSARFEDAGILSSEDTGDADTGGTTLRADDTRTKISINPGFTWTISELDQISLSSSLSTTDYDLDFTGRADADYSTASISYLRAVSARQQVGIVVGVNKNDSEKLLFRDDPIEFTNDTDGVSLSVDYIYNISEQLSVNARVGRQESDSDTSGAVVAADEQAAAIFLGNDCREVTPTDAIPPGFGLTQFLYKNCVRKYKSTQYEINFTRDFERSSIRIGAAQSIIPGSTGTPQERVQISLAGEREFTEKLISRAKIIASDQETVSFDNISSTNRNFRGELSLNWSFTKNWALGGEYIYRKRKKDGFSSDTQVLSNSIESNVDSNEVGFYLRYYWEKPRL